jgi:hypothetical protein
VGHFTDAISRTGRSGHGAKKTAPVKVRLREQVRLSRLMQERLYLAISSEQREKNRGINPLLQT